MNIDKYYWEAKDENEAMVIASLLMRFNCYGDSGSLHADWWRAMGNFAIINGALKGGLTCGDRTKSTLDELFAMAKRGFKEAWEVAPKGYRLVTEEERREFDYPKCGVGLSSLIKYYEYKAPTKGWRTSEGMAWWKSYNDKAAFAVPLDFEFAPKFTEISPDEAHRILEEHIGGKVKVTKK